jgi:hypothetical protein
MTRAKGGIGDAAAMCEILAALSLTELRNELGNEKEGG